MNTIDLIRSSFEMSSGFSQGLLSDMADAPFARTREPNGHHAYWILGHLVVAEAAVLDQYLLGRANRHQAWVPLFGIGSNPRDEQDGGPSYEELLTALNQVRSGYQSYMDQIGDEDLDKPCHDNDWPGPDFESVGECLNAIVMHMCIHAGQAACVRRVAGRERLFI
ncbi:MAG: DinB family protein [Planctomycetota bacterium]